MADISIIVPLYNEEEGIAQLGAKLRPAVASLASEYAVELVFVDDGSRDATRARLESEFAREIREGTASIRSHERNLNLGAAIRTGGDATSGAWLVYLDSDCTYEPEIIVGLVGRIAAGADLATASPYHPEGAVEGVPPYRLALSKGLSLLYRALLGSPVHTYTSMVRAMRRELYETIRPERSDFSAVAEMMVRALRAGADVREVPAVLRVRKYGVSKLRILRVIVSHLEILAALLLHRRTAFLARRDA